jgi:CheY-like chemotaxis protein
MEKAMVMERPTADQLEGGGRILFVEDEVEVLAIGKEMLEEAGHTVFSANSGPAALALAKQVGGAIDVLVTDVVMPKMSGPELADELLSQYPHLKVLFMSGMAGRTLMSHGRPVAGSHLLHKPFTAEELNRRVRELLIPQSS